MTAATATLIHRLEQDAEDAETRVIELTAQVRELNAERAELLARIAELEAATR